MRPLILRVQRVRLEVRVDERRAGELRQGQRRSVVERVARPRVVDARCSGSGSGRTVRSSRPSRCCAPVTRVIDARQLRTSLSATYASATIDGTAAPRCRRWPRSRPCSCSVTGISALQFEQVGLRPVRVDQVRAEARLRAGACWSRRAPRRLLHGRRRVVVTARFGRDRRVPPPMHDVHSHCWSSVEAELVARRRLPREPRTLKLFHVPSSRDCAFGCSTYVHAVGSPAFRLSNMPATSFRLP